MIPQATNTAPLLQASARTLQPMQAQLYRLPASRRSQQPAVAPLRAACSKRSGVLFPVSFAGILGSCGFPATCCRSFGPIGNLQFLVFLPYSPKHFAPDIRGVQMMQGLELPGLHLSAQLIGSRVQARGSIRQVMRTRGKRIKHRVLLFRGVNGNTDLIWVCLNLGDSAVCGLQAIGFTFGRKVMCLACQKALSEVPGTGRLQPYWGNEGGEGVLRRSWAMINNQMTNLHLFSSLFLRWGGSSNLTANPHRAFSPK